LEYERRGKEGGGEAFNDEGVLERQREFKGYEGGGEGFVDASIWGTATPGPA